MANKRLFDILGLVFSVALTSIIAVFASQFEPGLWYTQIIKPTWTPPGWLFGPVWGILYLAMSISAWLIWRRRSQESVSLPLAFYLMQLAINGLWSWAFFGYQWIGLALVILIFLVLLVTVTTIMFLRVQKIAGLILLPYLLWISFAAILNFQIWRMN